MPKGIYVRTEKHRQCLSNAWVYDKHFTKECRHNISVSLQGKKKSESAKKNMKGHSGVYIRIVPIWNKGKKGVQTAWNKGLTKETDERVKKYSKTYKESRKYMKPIKKDTTIELKIQNFLTQLQIEYFTHKYMNIEHGYQCDIFIPSKNLVIECDGDYWHNYPIGTEIDKIRTQELVDKGYKVIRIWEHEIKNMNITEFKNKL